jgi:hypothetical protein
MDNENLRLEKLKAEIRKFFMASLDYNISHKTVQEILYFNKDLFDLERCIHELKIENKVNTQLDTDYYSESIIESFSKESKAFKSCDYSLPFLIHLCQQQGHNAEDLINVIDEFIKGLIFKLTYQDIIITKSGTTRCFTNTRFALRELRKFGLIYSEEIKNGIKRRVILPTPIGYLIALYLLKDQKRKPIDFLSFSNTQYGYNKPLDDSIRLLIDSADKYLLAIKNKYPEVEDLTNILKRIIHDYYEHILPNIELTRTKFSVNEKGLKNSMVLYYKYLADQIELSYQLKAIFLKYYTK